MTKLEGHIMFLRNSNTNVDTGDMLSYHHRILIIGIRANRRAFSATVYYISEANPERPIHTTDALNVYITSTNEYFP